jgi:hypothetical protein
MGNLTSFSSQMIRPLNTYIATQPNMNDHSRSIDIRHHAIRQDYVNGKKRIVGVGTQDNTSDILTKKLQPPLHIKHTRELNILQNEKQTLTNCATKLTLNFERSSDDPDTSRNRHLPQNQHILAAHTDAHPHTCRQRPTTYRSQPGTVRNTNLAPSRNSPSMLSSPEEAMMRVMIDLNMKEKR